MRLWGLVIVPLMIIVFKNLYSLTNGALLGIFFGAVNGSMWEQTKIVMLSYLVWSLVEAIGKRSGFHRFAVSRIISLWFVGIFCLATYLLIYALGVLKVQVCQGSFVQLPCVFLRLHSAQGSNTAKEKLNSFFCPACL